MHITTLFRSAKNEPPTKSDYYIAFLEEEKLAIMWYSAKHKTWTHTNIESDHGLSECFNCNVLAWASINCATRALAVHRWN